MNGDNISENEIARRLENAKNQAKESRARTNRIKKKLIILLSCIIVVGVILFCAIKFLIIPEMNLYKAYKAAEVLMENGEFDSATNAFQKLGSYKDSSDMALEAQYQKAVSYNDNGEYENAIDTWNALGTYSDSSTRAEQALYDWKEPDYQTGKELENDQQYSEAIKHYEKVIDYKDSSERIQICEDGIKESYYKAAKDSIDKGAYTTAISILNNLGVYKDSEDLIISAAYDYACTCYDKADYPNAITYFEKASGYKDSKDKIIQAYYAYGCKLMEAEDYSYAIEQFEKCENYEDTKTKILDSKYKYVSKKGNQRASNNTTYKYLKELVAKNYPGMQALYNSLYTWKINIIAINSSENDYSTNKTKISSYDWVYYHFEVVGGIPGSNETISYRMTLPGCYPLEKSVKVYVGYRGMVGCKDPVGGTRGSSTVKFYDSKGNTIGTGSVTVY